MEQWCRSWVGSAVETLSVVFCPGGMLVEKPTGFAVELQQWIQKSTLGTGPFLLLLLFERVLTPRCMAAVLLLLLQLRQCTTTKNRFDRIGLLPQLDFFVLHGMFIVVVVLLWWCVWWSAVTRRIMNGGTQRRNVLATRGTLIGCGFGWLLCIASRRSTKSSTLTPTIRK